MQALSFLLAARPDTIVQARAQHRQQHSLILWHVVKSQVSGQRAHLETSRPIS